MAREIIQRAIIKVVQPQIVRYTCDRCGKVCGTRENRKTTWVGLGPDRHYCEKTCHPFYHPGWERAHVLGCALCYADAERKGETWMRQALLDVLANP